MKASLIFAIPALALTASAEPIPRMKRETITLTSVAQNISDAMVKLDETVKPFGDDEVPVIRDVRNLIEALEAGAKHMGNPSNPISAGEITGLPNLLSTLKKTGKTLIEDLGQKKTQVEKARLCGVANSQMLYADTLSARLINATLHKLPQVAQGILKEQTEGLSQIIYQGAANFGPEICQNLVVEPSASAAPVDNDTAFPTVQPPAPAAATPTVDGGFRDIDPPSGGNKRDVADDNKAAYPVAPTPVSPTTAEAETTCTESDVYATISTAYPTSDVSSTTISTTAILPSTVTISVSSTISTTTVSITPSTSTEATTVPTTLTSIDTTECEDSVAPSTTSIPEATTVPTTVTSVDTTDCEESVAPSTTSPPEITTVPTTVTSVDTTECEESTPPVATPPVETPSASTPVVPSSFVTEPSSPPYPTGGFAPPPAGPTSPSYPTGVSPPSSSTPPPSPIPTAGAADTHVPVGLVAAVAAAMFLF